MSKKTTIIVFSLLTLFWVGYYVISLIDFEAIFDTPEEVTYHFINSLKDLNFERCWSKLSTRMQKDDFGTKGTFSNWMFKHQQIRNCLAYAQIQTINELEPRKVKVLLKNWVYGEYALLIIVKEKDNSWKVDKFKANLSL